MKIVAIALCAVVLCLQTTLVHASAVIIDTQGEVTIKLPDGNKAQATVGLELPDDTKITTSKLATLSLMLVIC